MRLFLALSLPEPLRERLAALCTGLPGARWVAPENLHLTLRFIGEVDGSQARDLDAALAQVRAARLAVTLAGVDRFGSGRKLRALWVGVEPNPELDRLYRKLDHAVRDAGLAPEGRKFKPHVTLARFKGESGRRLKSPSTQRSSSVWGVSQSSQYPSAAKRGLSVILPSPPPVQS